MDTATVAQVGFPELHEEIHQVRVVIENELRAPGGLLSQGLRDLAARDSKLLRPIFTILAARIQNGGAPVDSGTLHVAAAIELLHMATLIHDDIVDASSRRRGGPSLHRAYGSRAAVLMGDYLFARAFSIVAENANPAALALLAAAVRHVIRAEMEETTIGGDGIGSVRGYVRGAAGKTAVLFVLSVHLGAAPADPTRTAAPGPESTVVTTPGPEPPSDTAENRCSAEARGRTIEILRRIGYTVGIGFQITDDLLDLFGTSAVIGKPVATDLRQGVLTLPVILAVEAMERYRSGHQRARRLKRVLQRVPRGNTRFWLQRFRREKTIRWVRSEIAAAGGKDRATAVAERYTGRAQREIDRLPKGRERDVLQNIIEQLRVRAS